MITCRQSKMTMCYTFFITSKSIVYLVYHWVLSFPKRCRGSGKSSFLSETIFGPLRDKSSSSDFEESLLHFISLSKWHWNVPKTPVTTFKFSSKNYTDSSSHPRKCGPRIEQRYILLALHKGFICWNRPQNEFHSMSNLEDVPELSGTARIYACQDLHRSLHFLFCTKWFCPFLSVSKTVLLVTLSCLFIHPPFESLKQINIDTALSLIARPSQNILHCKVIGIIGESFWEVIANFLTWTLKKIFRSVQGV